MANRVGQIQARVAPRQAVYRPNGGTTARVAKGSGSGGSGSGGTSYPGPGIGGRQSTGIGLAGNQRTSFPTKESPNTEFAKGRQKPSASPVVSPPVNTQPWNAQYNLSAAGAEKAYGDKIAGLGSQRVIAQQNYGIDPGFNDYANNPYSRAALLRKSYEANSRGDTNSYAARGQLYAGSLANAQSADTEGYNQGYDALNKEYLANLGSIDQEKAQALEAREAAINEARWRSLEAAQNEPLEPAPGPSTPNAKPKSNVNAKAKVKLGQARKAR